MPDILPFEGYYVNPARALGVVSPAYDSLSPAERVAYGRAHPDNFINTMRALEEFPDNERPALDDMLAGNAAKLKDLLNRGAFCATGGPCLFLYRMAHNGYCQTGMVAEISIDEYADGRLKRHEATRIDHENNLTRYHEIVGASSSPVCVAYPYRADIDRLIERGCRDRPVLDFTTNDGVRQTVWSVTDETAQRALAEAFRRIPAAYLTDGHHRAASAWRYAERMRAMHPGYTGAESFNLLLVALFSDRETRILPFNRCVRDLNGLAPREFVAALGDAFAVTPLAGAAEPDRRREFTMLLDEHWYRLVARPRLSADADPVRTLDVSLLHHTVLQPLLGIGDARSDPRLDYVPGDLRLDGLVARVREGWRVAFACHAMSIQEFIAVADAGQVMPPKSTWFDPKARSGVFLRLR